MAMHFSIHFFREIVFVALLLPFFRSATNSNSVHRYIFIRLFIGAIINFHLLNYRFIQVFECAFFRPDFEIIILIEKGKKRIFGGRSASAAPASIRTWKQLAENVFPARTLFALLSPKMQREMVEGFFLAHLFHGIRCGFTLIRSVL